MARIQIADLPRLEDLSPEQLQEVFGAGPRSYKPAFEALEERQLMSGLASVQLTAFRSPTFETSAQYQVNVAPAMQVYVGDPVAPVAGNLNQPTQLIPQEPLTPAAGNLNQSTPAFFANTPVLQTQTNLYTALQPAATGATSVQQKDPGLAAYLNQPAQNVYDGHLSGDPTPHIASTDPQVQGQMAIENKVAQLGGYAALGAPVGAWGNPDGSSQPTADGIGRFQAFQGGSIYWSPATAQLDLDRGLDASTAGAHWITSAIRDKFLMLDATQFGYPMTDTSALPGSPGATFNSFFTPNSDFAATDHERDSMIVNTPGVGAFTLSGETMYKWIELGAGRYGVPISDKVEWGGSGGIFSQDFRWGGPGGTTATIVWSAGTGAHEVSGEIRDRWQMLGAGFGLPTTDSTVNLGSGRYGLNQVVHFRTFVDGEPHDSALATTETGTFFVTGQIYTAWISKGGLQFGIPTSDEANAVGFTAGSGAPYRVSYFHSPDGKGRAIYWSGDPGSAQGFFGDFDAKPLPHFLVSWGDGQGVKQLDFTPVSGPTGFEPVASPTGTVSAPLTAAPPPGYSDTVQLVSKAQRALPAAESDTVQLVSKAQRALPPGESDTVQAVSPTSWASLGAAYATSDSVGINSPTADLLATLFPPADPGPHAPPPHPGAPSPGPGPAAAAPAADFTGVTFSLTSQLTGEVHQLQIESQVNPPEVRPQAPDGADGAAVRLQVPPEAQGAITFTALWDLGAAGESQATGTLSPDDAGNVHIRFTWGSLEAGTLHVFDGTITGEAGSYHIEGTATARPDGVSDPLVGDQRAHHDSPNHDPAPAGDQPQAAQAAPELKQVADFTSASFALTDDNGAAHQLQVQSQVGQPDGSASFTAAWDGQNATGTLAYDVAGNVHVTFSTDSYSFDGTISGTAGAYHLDSNVTGADGTTVHAAGDQAVAPAAPVADLTNVGFALADDNGAAHQLQVQAQVAQPDGSSTFTAAWDGQSVTGTLAYDASGNVHVTWSSTDGSGFDGTITGTAGAYHLDGNVTGADGTTIPAAGDQSA